MAKQKETKMQAPDEASVEDAVNAALASAEPADTKASDARAIADAEERLAAQRIAAAQRMDEDAASAQPAEDLTEIPLVSLAAKGREALMEAMRQHAAKKESEPPYVPPPLSPNQQARLNEELEAGRRAQERHAKALQEQRELAARTNQPDPREGTTTPVHRPGMMVPNPKGGHGVYSPTA